MLARSTLFFDSLTKFIKSDCHERGCTEQKHSNQKTSMQCFYDIMLIYHTNSTYNIYFAENYTQKHDKMSTYQYYPG